MKKQKPTVRKVVKKAVKKVVKKMSTKADRSRALNKRSRSASSDSVRKSRKKSAKPVLAIPSSVNPKDVEIDIFDYDHFLPNVIIMPRYAPNRQKPGPYIEVVVPLALSAKGVKLLHVPLVKNGTQQFDQNGYPLTTTREVSFLRPKPRLWIRVTKGNDRNGEGITFTTDNRTSINKGSLVRFAGGTAVSAPVICEVLHEKGLKVVQNPSQAKPKEFSPSGQDVRADGSSLAVG